MGKPEILKKVFEAGLLVSPQALDSINDDNVDDVITFAKKAGIINIQNLDFLGESAPKQEPQKDVKETTTKPEPTEPVPESSKIRVTVREPTRKEKLSPKDFVDFYNGKYEGIRDILAKKTQAVSINNTTKAFSEVNVIGMIMEKNPQGFLLEDPTGQLPVVSKETGLEEEDVVGVSGYIREGKLINGNVTYPDIPLSRKIGNVNMSIVLTSKTGNADHTFTLDQTQKTNDKTHVIKSSPSWIEIKEEDTINMVYFDYPGEIDPEEATQWLKKRHLPHKTIHSDQDPYILSTIPDILWIKSKSTWTKIHKGVTIISLTEKDSVKVNLQNKQIDFLAK